MFISKGWESDGFNQHIYLQNDFAFVTVALLIIISSLSTLILPWHLFTYHPPSDFKRSLFLMLLIGVPYIVLVIVGRFALNIPSYLTKAISDVYLIFIILLIA